MAALSSGMQISGCNRVSLLLFHKRLNHSPITASPNMDRPLRMFTLRLHRQRTRQGSPKVLRSIHGLVGGLGIVRARDLVSTISTISMAILASR
ncbi:hypothetical protein EMPG_17266 [Blastomyces silverae]|uniref:Uncharacterized protein n=1 Tax=Blastomyces silverae TaxID=2060906 RepID=A0A0H1B830_9EURO|nr:hypothetical protein EMPG_17266 [Blastomyces silverae]